MTDKERLIAMAGALLINEADKLGVKVRCNRTRTQLKESKSAVADRILEARGASTKEKKDTPKMMPMPGSEKLADLKAEYDHAVPVQKPKRGQLIEYKGKSQNICAWAEELGISANTLYGRLYRLGWPIEKAFEGGKK